MIQLKQINNKENKYNNTLDVNLSVNKIGIINWMGLWTLTIKEIYRFVKIWEQTIISPLIMILLFYAVFSIGIGNDRLIGSIPFLSFVVPGLIMMVIAQNAFSNGSVSLVLSKLQGNVVDFMMAPLSSLEVTIAYVLSGVVRGIVVGCLSVAVLSIFTPIHFVYPFFVIYFGIMGSLMLSSIGVITGLCGSRFDHIGAIQNFIIMPATFLSGTFFSVSQLPEKWKIVSFLNPFYYMIDGFRYGFLGVSDIPVFSSMALLFCVNLVLLYIVYWLFAKGSGLKL